MKSIAVMLLLGVISLSQAVQLEQRAALTINNNQAIDNAADKKAAAEAQKKSMEAAKKAKESWKKVQEVSKEDKPIAKEHL